MGGWDNFLRFIGGSGEVVFKSILTFLRDVTIPASTERFIAREKFVVDTSNTAEVRIGFVGDDFQKHFLGKIEEAQCKVTLSIHSLEKASVDGPIRTELGRDREVTTLRCLFHLLSLQGNGQEGALRINGYGSILYIEDEDGNPWSVYVFWSSGSGGWVVSAHSVEDPNEWSAGGKVVSLK